MNNLKTTNVNYSESIDFLRFPLTLFILFLHGYTSVNIVNNNIYWANSYIFGLMLGETAVPSFFFISGFLFFMQRENSKINFTSKIFRRIKTLLVPYFIWNSLTILLYLILQSIPSISIYFSGNNKMIKDYSLIDYLRAFWDCGNWNMGNGTPVLCPYWYIRNLFLLALLSPVIYFIIKKCGWIIVLIPLLFWLNTNHNAFLLSSISFFTAGSLFGIKTYDIWNFFKKTKFLIPILSVLSFLIDFYTHVFYNTQWNLQIHRITIILCILLFFKVANIIQNKGFKWNKVLTVSSFFIYTIHYPIMLGIRKISILLFNTANDYINILLYFIDILLVFLTCLIIFIVLTRYANRFLSITTGMR